MFQRASVCLKPKLTLLRTWAVCARVRRPTSTAAGWCRGPRWSHCASRWSSWWRLSFGGRPTTSPWSTTCSFTKWVAFLKQFSTLSFAIKCKLWLTAFREEGGIFQCWCKSCSHNDAFFFSNVKFDFRHCPLAAVAAEKCVILGHYSYFTVRHFNVKCSAYFSFACGIMTHVCAVYEWLCLSIKLKLTSPDLISVTVCFLTKMIYNVVLNLPLI